MAYLSERVGMALQRLASPSQAGELFAVGRTHTAGEPVLWEEIIAFERSGAQSFTRRRSAADEGGAAIGIWSMPAEEWRVQVFANALCQVQFWNQACDSELMPGMELIDWSCVTLEGTLDLLGTGTSLLMSQMMPLDMELRRLANDLETSHQGASLRLALQVQPVGNQVAVRVGLINDGNRPCIVVNHFSSGASDLDFFRLERAALPKEELGFTGLGAEFTPVLVSFVNATAPDPWEDAFLILPPRHPLVLPITATVGPLESGSYIFRAVYSNYGLLNNIAGIPVIRGRAFSNEIQVNL